jgi:hypothetical protein
VPAPNISALRTDDTHGTQRQTPQRTIYFAGSIWGLKKVCTDKLGQRINFDGRDNLFNVRFSRAAAPLRLLRPPSSD